MTVNPLSFLPDSDAILFKNYFLNCKDGVSNHLPYQITFLSPNAEPKTIGLKAGCFFNAGCNDQVKCFLPNPE